MLMLSTQGGRGYARDLMVSRETAGCQKASHQQAKRQLRPGKTRSDISLRAGYGMDQCPMACTSRVHTVTVCFLAVLLAEILVLQATKDVEDKRMTVDKLRKLRMNKGTFESVQHLHYVWYMHSIKALLVQMGKELLPRLTEDEKDSFLLCLHRTRDKSDVVRPAQCMVEARQWTRRSNRGRGGLPPLTTTLEPSSFVLEQNEDDSIGQPEWQQQERKKEQKWRAFGSQKKFKTFPRLPTMKNNPRAPPLVIPQKKTKKTYRKLVMVDKVAKVDEHKRVKRSEYRLFGKGKPPPHTFVKTMSKMPNLLNPSKSAVQQLTSMITQVVNGNSSVKAPGWSKTYKSLLSIKKQLDKGWRGEGAKVYDYSMDDLIFDTPNLKKPPRATLRDMQMPEMIQSAFQLADKMRAHGQKTHSDVNFKMLSPRFAPLMPDKTDTRGVLSPSILSFYKDDSEDQIAPIPKILEATGMNQKDREAVLEMVMEVSGARTTVEEAMKVLSDMRLFGVEGEFLEVTKRVMNVFDDLEESFNAQQKKDIKKRGYAHLEKQQLLTMYEKQGVKASDYEDLDVEHYSKLTRRQRDESLWLRVEQIASNHTEHRRHKRQIPPPSFLSPTVLAPYMFKPILGLVVLGPTVLSPSIFAPLILNPAMLSPFVLSPAVAMPFIISPYVLSPYVLSPLVMAPFILNPYVLSPNVVNPYVLSPLILSPLVLCPDVISPMVLGGAILSPSVLSPNILSKSSLMASVLSPSFLS